MSGNPPISTTTAVFRRTGLADGRTPLVLASPHSGRLLPDDFHHTAQLPALVLRRLEDAHVGALLRQAAQNGVVLFEALHARAAIDLNRAPHEYDPAMIAGQLAMAARPSARVNNGYGLFPKIAAPGQPIHRQPIPAAVAEQRIAMLYRPWHAALAQALQTAHARHGYAILLDVHSMPGLRADRPARIVLGCCHGNSAAGQLVDWLQDWFETAGLRVARNTPYAGGFTTAHHGRPAQGIHAVQIEIDRNLYMDPYSLAPHAGFACMVAMLANLVADLQRSLPLAGLLPELPAVAE